MKVVTKKNFKIFINIILICVDKYKEAQRLGIAINITDINPCPSDLGTVRSTISPYLYPFVIEVKFFL